MTIVRILKRCPRCGETKSTDDFSKNKKEYDRLQSHCKRCCAEYKATNRRRIAQQQKEYKAVNKEKTWAQMARCRASKRHIGFPWSIVETEKKLRQIGGFCPVLGIPFVLGVGKLVPGSPSIDILDPLGDPTDPNNYNIISHRANAIKQDATEEELRVIADWIKCHDKGYIPPTPLKDK